MSEDAVRIPLRAKDGSVRGYALIDAADAEWANRYRWHMTTRGYPARCAWIDGRVRSFRMHRELLGLVRGDGKSVDHIDRNVLNNRRSNLREIPLKGNQQNKPSYAGSSSAYRGVAWNKLQRKWTAQFKLNGKMHHLGVFDDELAAAEAARSARLREMPYAID